MDLSLGFNIFTLLFLSGTFAAALVAGLGGFAFGIVAAAIWLYILTPLQTATLIIGLGLVVQGYSVWKLRHALDGRRLAPLLIGTAFGVPLGVFVLAHTDPRYLRLGIGVVLVLFSLYGLLRPNLRPIKSAPLSGDLGAGFPQWRTWRGDRSCRSHRGHLVPVARLGQGSAARRVSASRGRHFRSKRRVAWQSGLDLESGRAIVSCGIAHSAHRHVARAQILRQARRSTVSQNRAYSVVGIRRRAVLSVASNGYG
jgi:hypothetical protein